MEHRFMQVQIEKAVEIPFTLSYNGLIRRMRRMSYGPNYMLLPFFLHCTRQSAGKFSVSV